MNNKNWERNKYTSGSKTKGINFEVRVCVNCEKISYSTPCAYCNGGMFKFVKGYEYQKPISKNFVNN